MSLKNRIDDLESAKSWFIEKNLRALDHPLKPCIEQLLLVSDYAARHINLVMDLLAGDEVTELLPRSAYFRAITSLNLQAPVPVYSAALRRFRHTQLLRLLVLERAKRVNTEEVMSSWSDCADAIILNALSYCQQLFAPRYGVPRDEAGNGVMLYPIAMGKLGGRELNYSSDVDLIFAFSASGNTDGKESLTNEYYFTKVVQQFIQLLHHVSADGFVFRVDLRLRPNGESGALVSSLAAMETYYQEQGRDWERYAMVKGRVITEDVTLIPAWFQQLITPFVYRRYVDFSVIESLRSMKAMIEREVQLNPRLDDIKRGQGGIREVEFIIQNFQLIRGGRMPELQEQNAMAALAVLKQKKLLPRTDALRQAYLYFRQLENVVQSLNDQQTHSLPEDPIKQAQVTLAMGTQCWEDLVAKLQQYQRIVSHIFHSMLGKSAPYQDEKRLLDRQLASLWQGHSDASMGINLLASLGCSNAEHVHQMIHSFRHGPRCRRLSQGARIRLDRFMVMFLTELTCFSNTDAIVLQVIHLLENIVGRSSYLALLTENPQTLKELLYAFAHSPFIGGLIVNHPFLLEVLLDQEQHWRPVSRHQLSQLLQEQLSHTSDSERQGELLRQFKLTHWLLAAQAELHHLVSAVRIGQFLADVAQVIVTQVFELACQHLLPRYPELSPLKSGVAIIAYGTLGSREMNYTSDLDLVFLYAAKASEEALVTRLTQKILHMLTTRSQTGVLFKVDTRLRPSGSAGLLVSHLDSFIQYQKNQAWIWEHQALLKARVLSGSTSLQRKFLLLKGEILSEGYPRELLKEEILTMRSKLDHHQQLAPLKGARGGLVDLEFLIQFLVLRSRNKHLAKYTHTLSLMNELLASNQLKQAQFILLKKAYQSYHDVLHRLVLNPALISTQQLEQEVITICSELYGEES